ncbi:MAG TPA: PIN domain-containing protein [Candidatus Solibacter sp.]|nr:PIN domain-containing protein [Candidatus Solibacter sp.]
MSRYCLDTVAYSYFKRGDSRIAALLDEADWIGIPVIVLGELFAGFEHGVHRERNIRELEAFLSFPMVEVLQVNRQAAEMFGRIVADLRRRRRPLPVNDIWIAACCAHAGATLLTWDQHFHDIPVVGCLVLK